MEWRRSNVNRASRFRTGFFYRRMYCTLHYFTHICKHIQYTISTWTNTGTICLHKNLRYTVVCKKSTGCMDKIREHLRVKSAPKSRIGSSVLSCPFGRVIRTVLFVSSNLSKFVKFQLSWVRSQHLPNLRGGRWSSVEDCTYKKNKIRERSFTVLLLHPNMYWTLVKCKI
jgi:hypothetical protein